MSGWWGKGVMRFLQQLRRDECGFSIIEFGAIAPFLGLLVVGMADLGRGYTERFALQSAVNRTLEFGHLGTRKDDYTFLKTQAATAAGVPATQVTVEQWLECDNNGTKLAFTGTCTASSAQIARYVKLTVYKDFDPLFTSAGYPNVQTNGNVRLTVSQSLRVQ